MVPPRPQGKTIKRGIKRIESGVEVPKSVRAKLAAVTRGQG